jgi:hypothetical protein
VLFDRADCNGGIWHLLGFALSGEYRDDSAVNVRGVYTDVFANFFECDEIKGPIGFVELIEITPKMDKTHSAAFEAAAFQVPNSGSDNLTVAFYSPAAVGAGVNC